MDTATALELAKRALMERIGLKPCGPPGSVYLVVEPSDFHWFRISGQQLLRVGRDGYVAVHKVTEQVTLHTVGE